MMDNRVKAILGFSSILISSSLIAAEPEKIPCATALATTMTHYNNGAADYVKKNGGTSPNVERLRNEFLAMLPEKGTILDLGAAHGRETLFFKQKGFLVQPVEPAEELAKILESQIPDVKVDRRIAQDLDYRNQFDGVWSMAVLHHIPTSELKKVFQNISRALRVGGVAHASFISGVGSIPDQAEIDEKGRYWSRVSGASLRAIIREIPELEIIESMTTTQPDDFHKERKPSPTMSFFNLTVRKNRTHEFGYYFSGALPQSGSMDPKF